MPSIMVLEGGAQGKGLGRKGRAFMSGNSALYNRLQRAR